MNLTINGRAEQVATHDDATFSDLMQIVSRVDDPGVGVTNVKLNGKDITGADWSSFSALPVKDIEHLEVHTGNLALLAGEMLNSVDDFTWRLVSELGRSSEAFRIGDQQRAFDSYARTLDGIQLLTHTTSALQRNLGIDPTSIMFAGRPSHEYFSKLQPLVDDMFAAQSREDWVLLADLIEYELIPQFEDRQRILRLWSEATNVAK